MMKKKRNKRKQNKRIRIFAFLGLGVFCILCCGCGKKGGAVLIGSTENRLEESETSTGRDEAASNAADASSGASEGQDTGAVSRASETEAPREAATIRVYVCGAVANPGVVEIPMGSRAEDALLAAGGFGEEAARDTVNLADWVNDGQKLYIPAEGEEVPPETVSGEAAASAAGLVNINTADAAALCTLPGVGESRAADIIAYREANGGFDSCEDIMKVPGIKNAMYEKMKDKITVK